MRPGMRQKVEKYCGVQMCTKLDNGNVRLKVLEHRVPMTNKFSAIFMG